MPYPRTTIIILFSVLINLLSQSHAIEESVCDSQQILPSHFIIHSLEVANDESYMIFTLDTDGLARDTLLYNFETEETRNLSPDDYINQFNNTQLTSDSQYLVYTTRRQGDQQSHLFSMTIATGESRQLSLPYEVGIDHTGIRYIISPDNESVVYTITDASSPVVNTLYVADIIGEETIEIMPDVEFYTDEDYRDPGAFIGLSYSRFSEDGRYFYFSFFTLQNGNQFYVLDMDTFDFQLISNAPGILYKTAGHSIQHHDYDYLYTTEAIGEDDVALYAFDIETGETTRLSPQFPDNVEAIISVTFNENANPARPQEYFVYSGDKKQLYQVSTDGQTLELIHDFQSNNFWQVTDGYWYVQRDFDVDPYQQWQSFSPLSNLELTIPVEIDEDYRIEVEPPSWFRIGDYAFTYARSVSNPSDSILYFIHYSPEQDWIARQITPSEGQDAFISTRPKSWDGETVYFVLDNRLYSGQAPFDDLQLLTNEDLIVSSISYSFENGNLLISATEPSMENRSLFILDCGDSG